MTEQKKSAWETILQSGGVAVTAISVFGVAITGYLTFVGGGQTSEADISKAQIEATTEQIDIASDERIEICDQFFEFLGDETMNSQLGEEAKAAVDRMVVQNSEKCTISDDASGDALTDGTSDGASAIDLGAGND